MTPRKRDESPLPPKEPETCQSPTTNKKSSDAQETATPVTSTSDSESPTTPETSTSPTTSPQSLNNSPIPGIDEYTDKLAASYESSYHRPARGWRKPDKTIPMNPLGVQLSTTLKEIFYQYVNRSDRSQQMTLGPSEIGSPCERRLAMSLMRMDPVNPGGDSWASFVGTCVHAGLADMFEWADAGKGRFSTEMRVELNSLTVPKGTLDLLDRVLFMVDDHKIMGRYSMDKLREQGPPAVYRTQVHVYGLGARLRGERVDHVAIISWPRERSSLDDLYVWTEPYDPQIARDAIARVEEIQQRLMRTEGTPQQVAATFPVSDDCRYCPYYMKDAKDLQHGCCNGRI